MKTNGQPPAASHFTPLTGGYLAILKVAGIIL